MCCDSGRTSRHLEAYLTNQADDSIGAARSGDLIRIVEQMLGSLHRAGVNAQLGEADQTRGYPWLEADLTPQSHRLFQPLATFLHVTSGDVSECKMAYHAGRYQLVVGGEF